MKNQISSSFITAFTCGLTQHFLESQENVEKRMERIGYEIGKYLTEKNKIKRHNKILILLNDITYKILPFLYKSNRKIEKSVSENAYLIVEDTPLIGKYVSVPDEHAGFSGDAVVCGVIEYIFAASGYRTCVSAYLAPIEGFPCRTIYFIKINEEDVLNEKRYSEM